MQCAIYIDIGVYETRHKSLCVCVCVCMCVLFAMCLFTHAGEKQVCSRSINQLKCMKSSQFCHHRSLTVVLSVLHVLLGC